jgi:hypothetical protein
MTQQDMKTPSAPEDQLRAVLSHQSIAAAVGGTLLPSAEQGCRQTATGRTARHRASVVVRAFALFAPPSPSCACASQLKAIKEVGNFFAAGGHSFGGR